MLEMHVYQWLAYMKLTVSMTNKGAEMYVYGSDVCVWLRCMYGIVWHVYLRLVCIIYMKIVFFIKMSKSMAPVMYLDPNAVYMCFICIYTMIYIHEKYIFTMK